MSNILMDYIHLFFPKLFFLLYLLFLILRYLFCICDFNCLLCSIEFQFILICHFFQLVSLRCKCVFLSWVPFYCCKMKCKNIIKWLICRRWIKITQSIILCQFDSFCFCCFCFSFLISLYLTLTELFLTLFCVYQSFHRP